MTYTVSGGALNSAQSISINSYSLYTVLYLYVVRYWLIVNYQNARVTTDSPSRDYLCYLCRPADTESRRRLRSASSTSLDVRRTRLSTVGDRAFSVAAARLWNSLPLHVTAAPLSASSAVVLNHISSHFLAHFLILLSFVQCPRSDSSFWTL